METLSMKTDPKAFLENVLGCAILKWESNGGVCGEGDNMAGSVQSVKVTTEQGKEVSLIYKYLEETSAEWIVHAQMFPREFSMYRTIIPKMEEFCTKNGLSWKVPAPRFYKGFTNDKNDYMVLEDMRPLGFKMLDKRETLSLPVMKMILEELARFHAVSYALLRYEGERILEKDPDFAKISGGPFPLDNFGVDIYDQMLGNYINVACDIIEKDVPELAERVKNLKGQEVHKIRRKMKDDPKYFSTLNHSDLWTNNLLVQFKNGYPDPSAVCFIDFQMGAIGNIFSDLEYLVFTSTTKEFRKNNLLLLLNNYYEAFSKTLKALRCPLPIGFSLGYLIDEFNLWRLPALAHMSFAIPLQLGDLVGVIQKWKQDGKEIDPMMDPEGIEAMFRRSDIAMQRIKDLFIEAAEFGSF